MFYMYMQTISEVLGDLNQKALTLQLANSVTKQK